MRRHGRYGDVMSGAEFFRGRRVLVTGHTGFKGSWLCLLLHELGAKTYGYSLVPPTAPSLFEESRIGEIVNSEIGDIRDYDHLYEYVR